MTSALMAFLHHIFAFGLTACLVYELVTFRRELTLDDAHRIQRTDLMYGNMPRFGLAAALEHVQIGGRRETARKRLETNQPVEPVLAAD